MFPSTFPGPLNHQLWNPDEKLVIGGVVVTFGFEAEFKCQHQDRHHDRRLGRVDTSNPEVLHVINDDFPFLEKIGNTEALGNWEVQSKPYETLGECMRDMKIIKEYLRVGDDNTSELRSFHLHMHFPNSVTNGRFNDPNFRAWVSRIGDAVLLWRIQYRSLRYTFENNSMIRRPLENLKYRGTVRLTYMNRSYWDLELRGFMTARSQIRYMVCIICTALAAKSFHGFHEFQIRSTDYRQQPSLGQFLNRYNPSIDPENPVILELQNKSSLGYKTMHPVLYGFESAPYFTDVERSYIVKANKEFAKEFQVANSYSREYRHWYYEHLRKWAKSMNLHHMLLCTLLRDPYKYSKTVSRAFGVEYEVFVKGVLTPTTESSRRWMDKLSLQYFQAGLKTVRALYSGSKYYVWQIKPDRSIQPSQSVSALGSGYELVSPILFFDGHIDDVKKALEVCTEKTGGIVNRTCGFHVHVGIEGLTLSDLKRISLNFLHYELAIDLIFSPSRRDNPYCRSNVKGVMDEHAKQHTYATLEEYVQSASTIEELCLLMNPITSTRSPNAAVREKSRRYHKLNYQNLLKGHMAIEFRQHEGTLSFEQTMFWIRLVLALVESDPIPVHEEFSMPERLEFLLTALDAVERRSWIRHESVGDFLAYFRTRGQLPSAPPETNEFEDNVVYLNARETALSWTTIEEQSAGHRLHFHPDLVLSQCALFSLSFHLSGLQNGDYVEVIAATDGDIGDLFLLPYRFSTSGVKSIAPVDYPRHLLPFKEQCTVVDQQLGQIEVVVNNLSEFAFLPILGRNRRLFHSSRITLGLRHYSSNNVKISISRFEALSMVSMRR